jgi:uncharacterized protein (TIGR03437 family)
MANWQTRSTEGATGPVEAFWVDPQQPQNALAALGTKARDPNSTALPAHILRTQNFGLFWDNLGTNLGDTGVHGVAAGRSSGAVYLATDQGLMYSPTALKDVTSLWRLLPGLPQGKTTDVKLDPAGNTLWAAVEGYGVYVTQAPHRQGDPRLVSSADLLPHAAAPGSLMTVTGAQITAARTGNVPVAVLGASETESQIQIPFNVRGSTLALSVVTPNGERALDPVPLEAASPVIFVDRAGTPVLFDSESGNMVDSAHPGYARGRIQIMATGLGRVRPEWTSGVEAPAENPPNVVAEVRAYLDGVPVNVTLKQLAPLYTGWNLVEIEVPKIVNRGAAEMYLEVDGHASNHVRVYIEP